MAKAPEDRFPSCRALITAARQALTQTSSPVPAPPPGGSPTSNPQAPATPAPGASAPGAPHPPGPAPGPPVGERSPPVTWPPRVVHNPRRPGRLPTGELGRGPATAGRGRDRRRDPGSNAVTHGPRP
jgi:serine/threonine-protein kinase